PAPARSASSSAGPSSCASVRSTTSTARAGGDVPARRCVRRATSPISSTSWPAAASAPCTREPNSRSATSASTSAIALLRPQAAEVLAYRLRPAPHLRHLDPSAARLAHDQLALDAGIVEQLQRAVHRGSGGGVTEAVRDEQAPMPLDRKSTRLNSSHQINSYAVFCLKKKKTLMYPTCKSERTRRNMRISKKPILAAHASLVIGASSCIALRILRSKTSRRTATDADAI